MDKTIRKNVSGFTNNSEVPDQPAFVSDRWQPDWPDYTITIAWPQTPPDLLSIPANQLKQLMLQARAYDPRAIEIFTTLKTTIQKPTLANQLSQYIFMVMQSLSLPKKQT